MTNLPFEHLVLFSVLVLLHFSGLDQLPRLLDLMLKHVDRSLVFLRQSHRGFYARSVIDNCVI